MTTRKVLKNKITFSLLTPAPVARFATPAWCWLAEVGDADSDLEIPEDIRCKGNESGKVLEVVVRWL